MPDSDRQSQVSLEALLRLKRAERPSPEFWSQFERELRQKQLTALVKKRRWWHEFPVLIGRRAYLPAGAAAVVAMTFFAVRQMAPTTAVATQSVSPQAVAMDQAIETLPTTVVASLEKVRSNAHEEPVVAAAPAPAAEAGVAGLMPSFASAQETESPSARSIAANLARLEQAEPELVNSVMGGRLSSPARAQTVAMAQPEVEPAVATDSGRKYRLIARYADRSLSPEPSAPALVRERIARRLGDDLGDGISRIGVVGSRVSLKF